MPHFEENNMKKKMEKSVSFIYYKINLFFFIFENFEKSFSDSLKLNAEHIH